MTGQLWGTPAYMAPERLQDRAVTPRCDIYSVGIVLYEALAGTKPFVGATPLAIAAAIERGDHKPLAEACPGLQADLVEAVEMAMAPEPNGRFASADQMRQFLATGLRTPPTEVVSGDPTGSSTVPFTQLGAEAGRTGPRIDKRHSGLLALLVAIFLAGGLLAGLLVSNIGTSHAPTTTVPTTAPTSTSVPATTAVPSTPPTTAVVTTPPPAHSRPKAKAGHERG
jgi:serine/threonine-protein kinase